MVCRQKVEENLERCFSLGRRGRKVSQRKTEYACERERGKWSSEVTESREKKWIFFEGHRVSSQQQERMQKRVCASTLGQREDGNGVMCCKKQQLKGNCNNEGKA